MPTYEYVCSSCGDQWETVQKISEAPLTECPKCHAPTAKRQISGGNFILKGSGWYADLYSSPKPKSTDTEGKTDDKASSGSGKEGSTSSDAGAASASPPAASKESGTAPSKSPAPTPSSSSQGDKKS